MVSTAFAFAGSIQDIKWESVQVGQVLQVNDDELFPADLMCLYTALPDKASQLAENELRSYTVRSCPFTSLLLGPSTDWHDSRVDCILNLLDTSFNSE